MPSSLRITLVSPPTTVYDRYPKNHPLRRGVQITEPLGLAYLASMIEDISEVKIVDCIVSNLSSNDCVDKVKNEDIIGISVVDQNAETSKELTYKIKAENPDCKIFFGGIHPSLYPVETLKNSSVDLVVIGEGEHTLREIVLGKPLEDIKGLAYVKNGSVIINDPRPLERNLDVFPFPARHLLPMEKYHPFLHLKQPVHMLTSSRGCPFTCTFCCRDIFGQSYRVRSVSNVVEEIKILMKQWGSKEVGFQDPIFGLNSKWLIDFCNVLIDEKLDVVWAAMTRVDIVNVDLLKLMHKSGCWMIFYGVEAGNQHLLDVVKKKTKLDMIKKSVEATTNMGIKAWGSFMFALPEETPELAKETLEFAKSLPFDFASFHLTTPYRGTELEREYKKYGVMKDNLEEFTQLNPVFIPYGWVGREEELKQFYSKAFKRFYVRPKYIMRQISRLRSWNEAWMYMRRIGVLL